ncbi:solute carrier family 23 member 1-like [Mizuhopecten yessoensis]|nr:solute carrier family 23 member 1-like [Mizuhopecten yessoensis]
MVYCRSDNKMDTNVYSSENKCASPNEMNGKGVLEVTSLLPDVAEEAHNEARKYPDVPSLRYGVGENPPILLSLILAIQNVMLSFGMNLLVSVTIADLACADRNDPIRAKLFCTSVFVVGLTTVVQSAVGIRIPILQGVSGAFLGPLVSMKTAGVWSCDSTGDMDSVSMSSNQTLLQNVTMATKQELVYYRVTQLQGSLMVSGLVTEVFLGGTGLLGYLVKLVGPITVCVTITSLGLSLYPIPIFYCSKYLPVAVCGTLMMILFVMYLTRIYVTIPTIHCNRKKATECNRNTKLPIFQTFPLFISVVITWALCGVLTLAGVFPDDPSEPAYGARTDTRGDLITLSPWLFFPYPGQFGPPRFNTAIFIGFVSSYLSSNVESIGDYMIVSRATGTFPPPRHAINRGILTEGIMGVVAGALGAGHATTSYSDNVVIIKITQVASRSVMLLAGSICLLFGVIGKFGAVLASLPDPVMGGVTIVLFGLLVSIGLSSLQRVNLSSTRNLAVLGTSLYTGLVISEWLKLNKDSIDTGYASLDQVLKLILGTQMFVSGLTSIILDNTVRGTTEERGMDDMTSFKTGNGSDTDTHHSVYDVPGVSQLQRKIPLLRHIPFLQPYRLE